MLDQDPRNMENGVKYVAEVFYFCGAEQVEWLVPRLSQRLIQSLAECGIRVESKDQPHECISS